MAGYFSYFPKTLFTFDKNSLNQQAVTNLLARSKFVREVANNTSVYFKYQVQDSDTPEIIAHKIYGDPYRSWLVLLFNNYVNPNYEFPLKEETLEDYVVNKYNQTLLEAKDTIHHYEKEVTKVVTYRGTELYRTVDVYGISDKTLNSRTSVLSNTALPTVADTSVSVTTETLTLPDSRIMTIYTTNKAVSNYTYEFLENEKRREIILVDPAYVGQIESEFKQLMRA
jgi:Base plate wedge protein 53